MGILVFLNQINMEYIEYTFNSLHCIVYRRVDTMYTMIFHLKSNKYGVHKSMSSWNRVLGAAPRNKNNFVNFSPSWKCSCWSFSQHGSMGVLISEYTRGLGLMDTNIQGVNKLTLISLSLWSVSDSSQRVGDFGQWVNLYIGRMINDYNNHWPVRFITIYNFC